MVSKFAVQRRCVVCGILLPANKSREELIDMGAGIRKMDGSVIWHCGRHEPVDILAAMDGVPRFSTAKKDDTNER